MAIKLKVPAKTLTAKPTRKVPKTLDKKVSKRKTNFLLAAVPKEVATKRAALIAKAKETFGSLPACSFSWEDVKEAFSKDTVKNWKHIRNALQMFIDEGTISRSDDLALEVYNVTPKSKVKPTRTSRKEKNLELSDAATPSRKPRKPRTPKTVNIDEDTTMSKSKLIKKSLTRIMDALNIQIQTVSVDDLVDAINNAGTKTVNSTVKTSKAPTQSSTAATFERVPRDFGFKLKDGRSEPAELKEKFKANLDRAKVEFPTLRVSLFNKLLTLKKESGIVSGLRKAKGEWIFICLDSKGKKFNVPVSKAI